MTRKKIQDPSYRRDDKKKMSCTERDGIEPTPRRLIFRLIYNDLRGIGLPPARGGRSNF
jgi:hypothetical protein